MTSIAIYAKAKDTRTMDQQVQSCREFAQAQGFTVTTVFTEDPRGRGNKRPEFQQLLAGLKAKKFDGVIAYDLDRFARNPQDLEDLIDVLDETGAVAMTVTGNLRLDTPDGISMARVMAAYGKKVAAESHRSRRPSAGKLLAWKARA